uniref:Un-named sa821 n=1 Tax=Gadus morhua TaxID=8049 RepID=A0A8C5FLE9_GADMO
MHELGYLIKDEWPGYSLKLFTYPEHYHEDVESVYIPHGVIMDRIERLARHIMEDISDQNIMVLCVLKGGYKFCCDLVEHIKAIGRSADKYLETRVEFIRLKSYLVGRDVPFLSLPPSLISLPPATQAIVDTGKTINALLKHVETFEPKMVKVTIPNRFVVGYALDYNEYFRDLNVSPDPPSEAF